MEDEKAIVILLKQGNSHAFTRLYDFYVKRIYSFAFGIVKSRDLAEDITHDVFVKIWENAGKLDSEKSFQSYLYTIARNQTINLIKRAGLETALVNEMLKHSISAQNYVDETIECNESSEIVKNAIDMLPPQRRIIYDLCKNEGLTYSQVAEQLKISPSTVNSQMVKALKSIKDFLLLHGTLNILLTVFYFKK
jgi:RNA polymerase sigma-70 factor (family 1)